MAAEYKFAVNSHGESVVAKPRSGKAVATATGEVVCDSSDSESPSE